MELSKTAYVILGMLTLGRRTGYEIKGLVDVSTRFFWAASYGQIYPELERLERAGLIRGERDNTNGRRRKSYDLTAEGKRALREWLTSEEPLHFELRHEGLLKLFFSDQLKPDERVAQVARIRAGHERMLEQFEAIRANAPPAKSETMPLEVLEWGIEYEKFIVSWCRRMERKLAPKRAKARS